MKKKLDNLLTGIILGTIIPVILYFAVYYNKFKILKIAGPNIQSVFLKILPLILSRCLLPGIILFFIFIRLNYYKSAKGILISSGIITLILLAINFVF